MLVLLKVAWELKLFELSSLELMPGYTSGQTPDLQITSDYPSRYSDYSPKTHIPRSPAILLTSVIHRCDQTPGAIL